MPSPFRLFSLADGAWQTLRMMTWYARLQAQKRLLSHADPVRPHTPRLTWKGKTFVFEIRRILDLHVLNEVFLNEEYALPPDEHPLHILDLGANIGASVACFALTFPNAHIAAFEPNPDCRKSLRTNVRQFGDRITVHEEAIAETDGEVTFYQNKEHWGGSLVKRAESRSYLVRTLALSTAVGRLGWPAVDLVKIDIEGGEYPVASDLNSIRPDQIIAEVHPDIVGIPYETFRAHFPNYRDQALYRHGERVVVHLTRR